VEPVGGSLLEYYPTRLWISAANTEDAPSMELWDGEVATGFKSAAPFGLWWSNSVPGDHLLTMRFRTESGALVSSAPVTVTVWTNQWPEVRMTSPTNDTYLVAPASVTFTATASDADGRVTRVEFFTPGKIASFTNAPYTLTLNNVPAGDYTVFAQATDDRGNLSTSPEVHFTVLPARSPPVLVTLPQDVLAPLGANVALVAGGAGAPPLQYQWQFEGINLAGATSPTLLLFGVGRAQVGVYTALVTNPYGTATASARLTLYSPDLRLTSILALPGNEIELGLEAPVGTTVTVETSDDYRGWSQLDQFINAAAQVTRRYPRDPGRTLEVYRLRMP
jgi:hypothetical protein